MASLEIKRAPLSQAHLSPEGIISGYASVFYRVDLGGDIVLPGAFGAALARRGARGIKMLYQHEMKRPIGVWTQLQEDQKGLCVQGRILPTVTAGREALILLKEGALDGLSIGYQVRRQYKDPKTGIRRLIEVDLLEISLVTFPMLPDARVASLKSVRSRGAHVSNPRLQLTERKTYEHCSD